MDEKIHLLNISKIYRIPSIKPWKKSKSIKALDGVNFSCPSGKITCLLGPNGAGKTSIIKILAGLVLPDGGEIKIQNRSDRSKPVRIGLATPNERSFYWRLTGRQNLDFFGSLYGLKGQDRKAKISNILSEIGIEQEADKPFRLYSSGIKQKMMLARALLGDPEILLLDEPTSHIDPLAKNSIHKLISRDFIKKRQTTVLVCTHDLEEAQKLSDHLVMLNRGKVIAQGSLSQLRDQLNPALRIKLIFLKKPASNWLRGTSDITWTDKDTCEITVPDIETIHRVVEAAVKAKGKLINCSRINEPLSGIFTRLTEG